ncbi:membrane protein insertase YidC [Sphingomonas sp.]|uniref:membrane protein insertase YidC n=1 Tax=Sphingomonas sp. TaxID=28214 RepID=UPI0025FE1A1A|nr:membrane protein insertase YidC [Sphingomonas sp.]MBV9527558.1 membrane protein insertase YidC [Sphingomonas sp.]
MNDNSKNMVLAVALSVLVLLGWSWAANRYFPTANPPVTKVVNGKSQPLPQPQASPAVNTVQALRSRAVVIGSTPRVRIDTPSLQGSINLKGAQIDDLVLVRQRETIAKDSPPVRLLSPLGAPGAYIASFGWTAQGGAAPGLDTVWTADSQALTPSHPVTLSTQSPDGLRYQIRIAVDDGYLFTVQQSVVNGSGKPVVVRPDGLVSRAAMSADPSSWTNHVGPIDVFGGKAGYDVNWKDLDQAGSAGRTYSAVSGWLGFTDKYWLTALIPSDNAAMNAGFRHSPGGGYQADYALAQASVAPGQTLTTQTRLFAGAKEKAWLDRYESAGIPKLSKSIDWGWFEWFMRPIFSLLIFLFHTVGNFGVAIICLTFIVRAIMFPVAQKQFQSMAAMRKVQPNLKAIQEKFKDDKPRQQQEIMKLYQAEKINPAAGCLPILIQIPIFYALYKVLLVSVEMRHQPFALWIHDLSAPDPMTPVNLFGLIPWTPPHLIAIGVLPILVGATQWLTMKLSPQSVDPAQQQILSLMPWFMVFVFAPFAAGLQLYYVTNNLLTLAQQWWLYRRFGLHLSDTHPVKT